MMKHIFWLTLVLLLTGCADSVVAPTPLPAQPYGYVPVPIDAVVNSVPGGLPAPGSPICSSMPPYGGNDTYPPTGGCFAPGLATKVEVDAVIAQHPNGTWGISGHGYAWAEQLKDGTWHIAVTKF